MNLLPLPEIFSRKHGTRNCGRHIPAPWLSAVAAFGLLASVPAGIAFGQGTTVTYQGRLNDGAAAATGTYDLRFAIYDSSSGGTPIAGPITNAAVAVSNGLLTTRLDFGAAAFIGGDRWLEIAVRTNGATGFVTLSSRQEITSAPYAIQALSAANAAVASTANSVSAAHITGTLGVAQLPAVVVTNGASGVSIGGTFAGNGGALTNIPLAGIESFGALTVQTNGLNFRLASTPAGPAHPYPVLTADVNGDGTPDLISPSYYGSTVTVLTNDGHGMFGFNGTVAAGTPVASVISADVNGDGTPDLVSVNETSAGTLTVLTNNGSGVFGAYATLNVGTNPVAAAAADVNGDGRLDLISANNGEASLSLLINNGNGTFLQFPGLQVGRCPASVVATNVTGGAKPDLICANSCDNTLTVLTNNGSGVFGSNATLTVGTSPICVVAADVNGDGKLDLISANNGNSSLTVLTNNGSGGFGFSATLNTPNAPYSLLAADLNNDGKVDLVSASGVENLLTVLTNNGSGTFAAAANLKETLSGSFSACAADVNQDGKLDLIAADNGGSTLTVFTNASGQLSTEFTAPDRSGGLRFSSFGGVINVINGSAGNEILGGVSGSVVAGGEANKVSGDDATVSGGAGNSAAAVDSTVGGGFQNLAGGTNAPGFTVASTVAGGHANSALAPYASIGGGISNTNSGFGSVIAGGVANTISNNAAYATVGGGQHNTAESAEAVVAGGNNNHAIGDSSTVGGGGFNSATGNRATVSGGVGNFATNTYATVPGGSANVAGGQYSFAAGRRANALHDGSFVWADSQNADFSSSGNNQFLIRAQAGVGINTATPGGALSVDTGGAGVLTVRNEANLVPGLVVTNGNAYSGYLRFRNHLEIHPNDAATASGYLDVRDTNGTVTISLNGQNGTVTANSFSGDGSALTGVDATHLVNVLPQTVFPGFQSPYDSLGGGSGNTVGSDHSTVSGGLDNTASGQNSTVPGGAHNVAAGAGSLGAGQRAKALHDGAFVWADSQSADFPSSGKDQFLVRAQGGVGIGMNAPVAGTLSVGTNIHLFDHPLYLRGLSGSGPDHNHGLAYSGPGVTNFSASVLPDGPVLWGFSGGALGVMNGGARSVVTWTNGGARVTGSIGATGDANISGNVAAAGDANISGDLSANNTPRVNDSQVTPNNEGISIGTSSTSITTLSNNKPAPGFFVITAFAQLAFNGATVQLELHDITSGDNFLVAVYGGGTTFGTLNLSWVVPISGGGGHENFRLAGKVIAGSGTPVVMGHNLTVLYVPTPQNN